MKPLVFTKSNKDYESVSDINIISMVDELQRRVGSTIGKLICISGPKTLLERDVITGTEQHRAQEHKEKANEKLAYCMDKFELWVKDNITEREEVLRYEAELETKRARVEKKSENIKGLIDKIAGKLRDTKYEKTVEEFKLKQKKNKMTLPDDPHYEMMKAKLPKCKALLDSRLQLLAEQTHSMEKTLQLWQRQASTA